MMDLVTMSTQVLLVLPAALPDSGPLAPPGIGDAFNRIIGVGKYIALGIAVLGLVIIGAKMAIDSRRGETTEEITGLIKVVLAVSVITGGASLLGFIIQGPGTGGEGEGEEEEQDPEAAAVVIVQDVPGDWV